MIKMQTSNNNEVPILELIEPTKNLQEYLLNNELTLFNIGDVYFEI